MTRLGAATTAERRQWWGAFALLALLMTAWNIATPRFGAPDEPAHAIRAASVVRGELLGREPTDAQPEPPGTLFVNVPESIAEGGNVRCFAFETGHTADCLELSTSSHSVEAGTTAGRHPPLFYAIVGVPSLVLPNATSVWLMRLACTLMTAALLASALASIRRARTPTFAAAGLAVAVTPVVLFVGGTISPSGPEIAAAAALWATGLALGDTLAGHDADTTRLITRAGIAAVVLALARQLGPAWIVLILAGVVWLGGPAVRGLRRDRTARRWVVGVGAAIAAQVIWTVFARPLDTSTGVATTEGNLSTLTIAKVSFGRGIVDLLREMVGLFGWRDTSAPEATYVIWIATVGALIVLAAVCGGRRDLLALLAVVGLTILIPVVAEARKANEVGYFWQGRYTLPLAIGVPLIAGWVTARGAPPLDLRAFVVLLGSALGLAQALAFFQAQRRYSVGARGAPAFWVDARWTPPGGVWPVTIAFLIAIAAWYIFLFAYDAPAAAPAARAPDTRIAA